MLYKIPVSVEYKNHTQDIMIFIPVALYSESNVENKIIQYVIRLISKSVEFL